LFGISYVITALGKKGKYIQSFFHYFAGTLFMSTTIFATSLKKLRTDTSLEVHLGQLPAGTYMYFFSIVNAFSTHFEIAISIRGTGFDSLVLKENFKRQNLNVTFSVSPDEVSNDIIIQFDLKTGSSIYIDATAFPQLVSSQSLPVNQTWATEEMINNLFIGNEEKRERVLDGYRPVDIYLRLFKEVQAQNQYKSLQSFSQPAPLFYELIDIAEAKKQLDYVVYNKFFSSTGGGALRKFVRKVYRRFFIIFYKLLTRSEGRKNVIAKLYRNYININYISERK
jgi:hypothetical protein